jgi:hypothetical protein
MILLEDVHQELNLDHKERHVAAGVDCIHGRVVGSAFVHRDFIWIPVRSHCLVEEALRRGHVALVRQQEVEGLRCLSMKSCGPSVDVRSNEAPSLALGCVENRWWRFDSG